MNDFHALIAPRILLDSDWANERQEDQSSRSSTVLTPSASSVGELTPPSSDNGASLDNIHNDGLGNLSEASRETLTSATGDFVLAVARPTDPLTTHQASASFQDVSEENIGRVEPRETPGQNYNYFPFESSGSYPERETTMLVSQMSMLCQIPARKTRHEFAPSSQHNGHPTSVRSPLSNRLNISLRIAAGSPSQLGPIQNNARVSKKRGRLPGRHPRPMDGASAIKATRRGRPSERGSSCSHCTIMKKRCIGSDTCCDRCAKSPIYRQLCIKAEFKESRLLIHDLYNTRITTLLQNVVEYTRQDPISEPITIKISNGFNSQLEIQLRHYIASDENALTHRIFRGLEAGMIYPTARSTSFALQEGTLTAEKIDQYCENLAYDIILKESLGLTRNSLLHHIMLFAGTQINHEDAGTKIEGLEMVRLALRLWAIQSIFFTYPWRIESGGHLIGMFPLQIPGYWDGITLLPRLVNQELDRAFETRMDEIEKETLEMLQAAIFKQYRNHWCAIFLTSFILLHSLERDSWNMSAWDYEIRAGGAAAWPLKRRPPEYCEQNRHIANIIATHFRIVNRGSSLLKQNWTKPLNQQLLSDRILARKFIISIQSDFNSPASHYKTELYRPREFVRDDPQSLNHVYTRMLFEE